MHYDADHARKCLVVNPEEAQLVQRIFADFLQCGSTTRLAQELNTQGHTTKSWVTKKGVHRVGTAWDKAGLYRLLHSPLYLGEVSYKGERYPGEHEGIVSHHVWDQVQAIFATNDRRRGARTRAETPALLRGLIRCAPCDCAMSPTFTTRRGKQYRYYLCLHASKNGHGTCPTKTLPAGEIEAVVVQQVRALFQTPELLARTYRSARAQADARAEEFREVEDFSEREVIEAVTAFAPIWEHLFPVEQERIVQLLVQSVEVHPDRAEVQVRADGLASLIAELQEEEVQ